MAEENPRKTSIVGKLKDWWTGGGSNQIVKPIGPNAATVGADAKKLPISLAYAKNASGGTAAGDDKPRSTRAEEALAVYSNNLRPLVVAKLREQFHPDNFARMKLMPNEWTNPLRRLVDDLSILYEKPATRRLVDRESEKKQLEAAKKLRAKKTQAQEETDAEYVPSKKPAADEEPPADATEPQDPKAAFAKMKQAKEDAAQEEIDAQNESPDQPVKPEDIGTGDPEVDALAEVLDAIDAVAEEESPYARVLKLVDLDVVMDKVEKLTRFLPAVWVRPFVRYGADLTVEETAADGTKTTTEGGDPKSGTLEYIIYTPKNAWVITDPENPTQAIAFCYWTNEFDEEKGEIVRRINFWNSETYWKLDSEWKILASEPNIYGRLPIAVFRSDLPVDDYYVDGVGQDLVAATLELCVWRTLENTRGRDAGFKQLALQNISPEDVPADQVMGGPTPIFTGEGTATTLDLAPNLEQFTNVVEKRGLELAASRGVSSAEYKAEGNPQSGFAKRLDRDKVLKENVRIRKFFAEGERDLYRLTAITLKEQPIEDANGLLELDPEAEFEIDFAEPTFTEDPKTQDESDSRGIKLNRISLLDVLRRDNPDLSDAELVRLAHKNKRINSVLVDSAGTKLIDLLASGGKDMAAGGGGGFGGGAPHPQPGNEGDAGGGKPPFGGK